MNFRTKVAKNYINFRGWKTKRKIVVFESDDWGSIRTPSFDVYKKIKDNGINLDESIFNKYDSLENIDDLKSLFQVLTSYKDFKLNHPKITALSLVANPDFEKIKADNFDKYYYLDLENSYKMLGCGENVLDYWKKNGLEKKLLWPQFHGREHLNPTHWLHVLKSGDEKELLAFKLNCLLGKFKYSDRKKMYMSAFEYFDTNEQKEIEKITEEGLKLFERTFGFKSESFMASQSIRGEHLDEILSKNGILYHQGGQQFVPESNGLKVKNRFWGEKNQFGMIYWRRNCNFEPSKNQKIDSVSNTLKEIEIAFRWGKPAVISTHRVNYIGSIFKENSDASLLKLDNLLSRIIKKWPQVEFLTSDELGYYMKTTLK